MAPGKGRRGVGAEATAKIEAVAKATYERKHTVAEVIPPDVTRAKAGAWLALISPITEWAGLRGDQLRYKRQLLRIQQDAILNKIVLKANKQLADEGRGTAPIPNKFLVPFLEQASLEDDDSELCSRWADLLVSAATAYDPSMIRFGAVLGEIGPGEVAFLERLIRNPRGRLGLNHIEDVPHLFIHGILPRLMGNTIDPIKGPQKLLDKDSGEVRVSWHDLALYCGRRLG